MMGTNGNIIDNNALAALTKRAGPQITSAIKKASARTGVDFTYLVNKAAAESSFNPEAKAGTSSATGLFQFIESTWLNMVKKHGHKYGLAGFAAQINENGKIADEKVKDDILALRTDPEKAALMAAEYAAENKKYLERYADLNKEIGPTELYFAHFMGAGGASAFLKAHEENPLGNAADLFPKEARANRGVFYDPKSGAPRTLAAVYDFFNAKFGPVEEQHPQSPVRIATDKAPKVRAEAYKIMQNHIMMQDKVIFDFIMKPFMNDFGREDTSLFPGFQTGFMLGPEQLALLSGTTRA